MGDEEYIDKKVPGRIYFSREIPVRSPGKPERAGRYISRVLPAIDRTHFANVEQEIVLRTTRKGREQIKAFLLVDDRGIRSLTLQRFSNDSGLPREEAHFTLTGKEIGDLLNLALLTRTADFKNSGKMTLRKEELQQFALSKEAVRSLLRADFKLVKQVIEQDLSDRDIVALAYRRRQLRVFERLLSDDAFFQEQKERHRCRGDEALWQAFFEANPWIFGYGLFYVFTSEFEGLKLEQIVAGANIATAGKRVDALLRTRGVVSSLCFVEIKTHRTDLLDQSAYRPETWRPSYELSGAVAQAQKTIERAEAVLKREISPRTETGDPTGETAFLLRPRSVVVAGSLQQFVSEKGINEPRFTCFELYRRQLISPEIITFDELFERARFIVESTPQG